MIHNDSIPTRLVLVPHPEITSTVQVSVHLRRDEAGENAYTVLRDEYNAPETSADGGDHWHRWAEFVSDDVRYVIHDPVRHPSDPLEDRKRVAELIEMVSRVALAEDMSGPEKVREIQRLTARMRVPDPSDSDLHVIANALAGPGVEQ